MVTLRFFRQLFVEVLFHGVTALRNVSPPNMALQAADLPPEGLAPGDLFEYYTQLYVAGDPRGRRVARVLRIESDKEYPLTIDTQELIPRLMLIKKLPVGNERCYWRRLRSFTLENGSFEAPTRADLLNEQLSRVVGDCIQELQVYTGMSATDSGLSSRAVALTVQHADLQAMPRRPKRSLRLRQPAEAESEIKQPEDRQPDEPVPSMTPLNNTHSTLGINFESLTASELTLLFRAIPTRAQKRVMAQRAALNVGLSPGAIRSNESMSDRKLTMVKQYITMPRVQEVLRTLRTNRGLPNQTGTGARPEEETAVIVIVDSDDSVNDIEQAAHIASARKSPRGQDVSGSVSVIKPCAWPREVTRIFEQINTADVLFRDAGDVGMCDCITVCTRSRCSNASIQVYCDATNCSFLGRCGNAPIEKESLQLACSSMGYTVYTTATIGQDEFVGEYCGELVAYEGLTTSQPSPDQLKVNSGFSMLIRKRSSTGKFVYIEPVRSGGITRFVNHSCQPNCKFVELHNRRQVRVFMVASSLIPAGTELSVDYGDALWFPCTCRLGNCPSNNSVI